jgi:orotidine-5'-phosphate decarboxylase
MLSLAEESGKGVFVLAATSNPEARPVQRALVQDGPRAGSPVARAVLEDVASWNEGHARSSIGSVGVVLGATVALGDFGIDVLTPHRPALPVLAPGFGHQGALVAEAPRLFGALTTATVVSESRSVLGAGPEGIAAEIDRRATDIQETLVR